MDEQIHRSGTRFIYDMEYTNWCSNGCILHLWCKTSSDRKTHISNVWIYTVGNIRACTNAPVAPPPTCWS